MVYIEGSSGCLGVARHYAPPKLQLKNILAYTMFASHVSSEGGLAFEGSSSSAPQFKTSRGLRATSNPTSALRQFPEPAGFAILLSYLSRLQRQRLLNLTNEIDSKRKNRRLLGEPAEVEK